jgi:hypothetical protein
MEVEPMKTSRHILSEQEMELVNLLVRDCHSTGDIQTKLESSPISVERIPLKTYQ